MVALDSGYTTGSQHGSPGGRLVFGVSSRSIAIDTKLSIETTIVNLYAAW
jgi:hypothetical protein